MLIGGVGRARDGGLGSKSGAWSLTGPKPSVFQKTMEFGIHWSKAIDALVNALADDICLAKRKASFEGIFVVIELRGDRY
jgi:hypothetical protein